MSSSLVILFGVVKQFGRFWIWSETECKTPAEYVVGSLKVFLEGSGVLNR